MGLAAGHGPSLAQVALFAARLRLVPLGTSAPPAGTRRTCRGRCRLPLLPHGVPTSTGGYAGAPSSTDLVRRRRCRPRAANPSSSGSAVALALAVADEHLCSPPRSAPLWAGACLSGRRDRRCTPPASTSTPGTRFAGCGQSLSCAHGRPSGPDLRRRRRAGSRTPRDASREAEGRQSRAEPHGEDRRTPRPPFSEPHRSTCMPSSTTRFGGSPKVGRRRPRVARQEGEERLSPPRHPGLSAGEQRLAAEVIARAVHLVVDPESCGRPPSRTARCGVCMKP
jgi:hypothetical protein